MNRSSFRSRLLITDVVSLAWLPATFAQAIPVPVAAPRTLDGTGPFGDRAKGLFIGGALRYQSKVFSQTDTRAPSAGGTGKDYYANLTLFADAFAGYRFRLPWQKLPVSLQLNVKNLTNSYLSTTARWNADFSGARRIYLRDPRSWRLTMSVDY